MDCDPGRGPARPDGRRDRGHRRPVAGRGPGHRDRQRCRLRRHPPGLGPARSAAEARSGIPLHQAGDLARGRNPGMGRDRVPPARPRRWTSPGRRHVDAPEGRTPVEGTRCSATVVTVLQDRRRSGRRGPLPAGTRLRLARLLGPARVPKPTGTGPGQPPGGRNEHPAHRYDVGKTVKRPKTLKKNKISVRGPSGPV